MALTTDAFLKKERFLKIKRKKSRKLYYFDEKHCERYKNMLVGFKNILADGNGNVSNKSGSSHEN